MNKTSQTILHLSLIPGIGPVTIAHIISACDIAALYAYMTSDFIKAGLSPSQAQKIVKGLADAQLLDQELSLLQKHTIKLTTLTDTDYPELLRHIHGPPAVLYYRGTLPTKECKTIACVGSRNAKQYAQQCIDALIPELVHNGWSVVSGGAIGADTMAHRTTLEAHGKTIAVLGSGLLHPYPQTNKKLFERIVETEGAVVSPFQLSTQPLPSNFPIRNRVISGMSLGCLVVQAAQKSGALITAYSALEQSREVFAIPGPIDNPLSAGCHRLIQQGAQLVTCVDDILQAFGFHTPKAITSTSGTTQKVRRVLSEQEQLLVDCCTKPTSIDEIMAKTGKSLPEVNGALFDLQLKGILKQSIAGLWECA